jgi:hypothetical protein
MGVSNLSGYGAKMSTAGIEAIADRPLAKPDPNKHRVGTHREARTSWTAGIGHLLISRGPPS